MNAAFDIDADAQPSCAVCGGSGRLLPVGHAMQPAEHVHRRCVHASHGAFGFCDVCRDAVAHRCEDLHAHGDYVECELHEGEFSSGTPEEVADRESLAEYLLGHPPQ